MARPSIYTKALGKKICIRLSSGESLRSICRDDGMPKADTVYSWLLDPEKKLFSEQYARARASQAELMFDELLEISDDSSQDTLCEKYGLNDRDIYRWDVEKEIVAKGKEFAAFEIAPFGA
jgi:hypothetical protein